MILENISGIFLADMADSMAEIIAGVYPLQVRAETFAVLIHG